MNTAIAFADQHATTLRFDSLFAHNDLVIEMARLELRLEGLDVDDEDALMRDPLEQRLAKVAHLLGHMQA